jgi:ABC-type multidrug transport system permease subunit
MLKTRPGSMRETTVPRALATILLIVSLAMLIPIASAVLGLMRGEAVASSAWAVPLVILATGLALMSFLPRMQSYGAQLYVAAFALWLLAAGYFFFTR